MNPIIESILSYISLKTNIEKEKLEKAINIIIDKYDIDELTAILILCKKLGFNVVVGS